MPLSFALSISHFVSSVGADAGFAALIGLAILVLLYFAHARETATLRDELLAARERLEDLERRPGVLTGVTPAPYPRPPMATPATSAASTATSPAPAAGRRQAANAAAIAGVPIAAPAGMGAPALIDATRVVPAFEEVPSSAEFAPEKPVAVPDEEQVLAATADGAPAPAEPEILEPSAADVPVAAVTAAPATSAGGAVSPDIPAAGAADQDRQRPEIAAAPLMAPGGTGAVAPPPPSVRRIPPPVRPAVGRTPGPVTAAAGGNGSAGPGYGVARGGAARPRSLLEEGLPRRRRTVNWLIPLLAVVAVGAIAAVLLLVLNGRSTTTHHHLAAKPKTPKIAVAPPGINPSAVTVAVLNGTTVNQLAHHISTRLSGKGFKQGILATNSSQSVNTTVVSYLSGHRGDALAVASALRLAPGDVKPASQSSKALACPGPALCSAQVIVVVGTDLAS